jgi:hypothetical protein
LTLAEESTGLAPMSDMILNYHLMHPGGDQKGRDMPNALQASELDKKERGQIWQNSGANKRR